MTVMEGNIKSNEQKSKSHHSQTHGNVEMGSKRLSATTSPPPLPGKMSLSLSFCALYGFVA
jgi:hypothetical protein